MATNEPQAARQGVITDVHDGDTATFVEDNTGEKYTIRFALIDAPEASDNVGYQPFGTEAGDFTRELINGKKVTVFDYGRDNYGRIIGRIMLEDGTDANAEIVKAGYAWHNRDYDTTELYAEYDAYEQQAREQKKGIWSDPSNPPQKPSEFRHSGGRLNLSTGGAGARYKAPPKKSKKRSGVQELNKTPIYVPFVTTRQVTKTENGLEESGDILKRYYSSIDAEIYFGNEYVEDICDIQWQIQQNHMPIFGFNSYSADAIAVGSRIVMGTFSIRFTSPNYLFRILETAKGEGIEDMKSYKAAVHDRVLGEATGVVDKRNWGSVKGTKLQELWPETFDIDIVYGHSARGAKETHVFLKGVRILSCSTGVSSSSPVPTTEVYQFVAKDIKTRG